MGMTILQAKQKLHENWMLLTTCGRDTELTQALSIAETVLGNYDDTLKAETVTEFADRCRECGREKVLNKIRAEIEKLDYLTIEDGSDGYDKYIDRQDVLQILDKYKAESEE